MREPIAPENEQFINSAIEDGTYADRADVLNAAVNLLRSRAELLEKIDEGTRQLRNGECRTFDDDSLSEFIDDVNARGQARYDAHKQQQNR